MKGYEIDLEDGIDKHDEKDSINSEYDREESELINSIQLFFKQFKESYLLVWNVHL